MNTTLLELIGKLIETLGVTNTIISIVLTIAIGFLYRNEKKQKKAKEDDATSQMANIATTVENQSSILYEVQRSIMAVSETIKELSGKFDSTNAIITELMKRDIGRSDVDKGGE